MENEIRRRSLISVRPAAPGAPSCLDAASGLARTATFGGMDGDRRRLRRNQRWEVRGVARCARLTGRFPVRLPHRPMAAGPVHAAGAARRGFSAVRLNGRLAPSISVSRVYGSYMTQVFSNAVLVLQMHLFRDMCSLEAW